MVVNGPENSHSDEINIPSVEQSTEDLSGVENIDNQIDITENLSEFQDLNDGYEEFSSYIQTLDEDFQKQFLDLSKNELENLQLYFMDNGYIINQETLNTFKSYFNIDSSVALDVNDVHDKDINTYKNEILPILEGVEGLDSESGISQLLERIDGLDKDTEPDLLSAQLSDIKYFLEVNNGENLTKILVELEAHDKENGTNFTQRFEKSIISLNPEFERVITNYRNRVKPVEPIVDPTGTTKAFIQSGLRGTFEGSKSNVYSSKTDDGEIISIDSNDIPPSRNLSLEGSKYAIDSDLPIADYYPAILKYERAKNNLDATNYNGASKILDSIDYVQDELIDKGLGINEIKTKLISTLGIKDVSFINSIDDLNPDKLFKIVEDYEQELEDINSVYEDDLVQYLDVYRDKIIQQDIQKRKTLDVLHRTGFDLLPKSITDNLIARLNSQSGLRKSLGFKGQIDIENGDLGIHLDENTDEMSKQEDMKLAEFINIILSGSDTEPVDTKAMLLGDFKFSDASGADIGNKEEYVNKQLGANPNERIYLNIEKYLNKKES